MGVVTSISGGAGVFAIPTLLAFGIPPVSALALNRISDIGVLTGAARNYFKSNKFDFKTTFIAVWPITIGALIAVNIVVKLPENILNAIVLGAVVIGMFFLLSPVKKRDIKDIQAGSNYLLGFSALFILGLWEGAFAMAGATFAVLIFVRFFKKSFLEARSIQIIAAIPETFISAAILSYHASFKISWAIAIFASSAVGAYLGSKLAIRKGDNFIRLSMVAISIVMVLKVLYDLIK
ncbi:MAG: hypothetical protein CL565_06800 [Alphaproteobacteria bacterium]|nr:hypothetical protein [Alphaproteobacteria bacterium]|tara:strand:- start:257 stop:964 length:708 start_codon:yes stop_codon:yes gene_type:complete